MTVRIVKKWTWAALALAALMALFFLNPTECRLMPKCPFKLLTGWNCPGCGFQRAVHALLHGRMAEAWGYNRFLIYAVPWLVCVMLTEWAAKGRCRERLRHVFEGRVAVYGYLVLFIAWGVARNMLGI